MVVIVRGSQAARVCRVGGTNIQDSANTLEDRENPAN